MSEMMDTGTARRNSVETRFAISPSTEENPNGIVYICYKQNGKWKKHPIKLTQDPTEYQRNQNNLAMLINPTVSIQISNYAKQLTDQILEPQINSLEKAYQAPSAPRE